VSGEVDSRLCDWCGESILLGFDEVYIDNAHLVYHAWCQDENKSEQRATLAEARATTDKWEEEV